MVFQSEVKSNEGNDFEDWEHQIAGREAVFAIIPIKPQLACCRRFDGFAILLDARPFILIAGQRRVLPSDGV
jgi:hypothetical protein